MIIQCMRWEIGCEADYDNVLDFRQLHKSRHNKMSKWPVNHDVCCAPFQPRVRVTIVANIDCQQEGGSEAEQICTD